MYKPIIYGVPIIAAWLSGKTAYEAGWTATGLIITTAAALATCAYAFLIWH